MTLMRILTSALLVLIYSTSSAAEYEDERVRMPSNEIVPADLIDGPHHRLDDWVQVDGFINAYTIESTFGTFTASGDFRLRARINEINTIAALRALDKTELAAQSAKAVASAPVKAVTQVATAPVDTVKGIPGGVSRLFKRTSRRVSDTAASAKNVVSDSSKADQESVGTNDDESGKSEGESGDTVKKAANYGIKWSRRFFGLDRAYRELAKKYQVDPYTDNELLKAELKSVSRYSAASSFVTGRVIPSLPSGVDILLEVGELVWNSDPLDLLIMNEDVWRDIGASNELIKQLFANPHFTITDHTRITVALRRLDGVDDRSVVAEYAVDVQSPDEARFIVRFAEFFAIYAENREPLTQLVATDYLPIALNENGVAVFLAPVDQLRWTKIAAAAAQELTPIASQFAQSEQHDLWVQGSVSETADKALHELGWRVNSHAFEVLQ